VKVIVIDDDPVALELSRAALESLGHQVETLSGAIGASAVILRERPDVVVVDIEMPGLSGIEWLRLLRERNVLGDADATRFILHTGAHADELDGLVEQTGAAGGIRKEGSPKAFATAFEHILRSAT
jgi:two-component system, response regulator PdtaR